MIGQNPDDWRKYFPIVNELAFFNHAGVGPLSGPAAQALRDYAKHAETRSYVEADWYRRVNDLKRSAAKLINADGPHEIAVVQNTSAGIATIAKGFNWRRGDNVVITDVEFPANRYPWEDLKRFDVQVIEVRQNADGRIDADEVADAVTDRTRVVAISHVQYASGHRIDLKPISKMVHMAGGYLFVDAIQSLGAMPVDVEAMGIDFLAADGHKWMLSPEGCGILYVNEDLIELLHPNVVGWLNVVDAMNWGDYKFEFEKDCRRFEPGSYNIPGVLALGASLEMLLDIGIDTIWQRIEALTTRLCEGLEQKGYRVASPRGADERSGIVIFDPPEDRDELDPARIVADLEEKGIIIVLREGRLRASPHFYNTEEQIDRLLEALP
jgi:selenocysteine lyase/cysteine desulfurase